MSDLPKCPTCGRKLAPKGKRFEFRHDATWADVEAKASEEGLTILTRRANFEKEVSARKDGWTDPVRATLWNGVDYDSYGAFDTLRCAAKFGNSAYQMIQDGRLTRR